MGRCPKTLLPGFPTLGRALEGVTAAADRGNCNVGRERESENGRFAGRGLATTGFRMQNLSIAVESAPHPTPEIFASLSRYRWLHHLVGL
jgi:hypothetical protein